MSTDEYGLPRSTYERRVKQCREMAGERGLSGLIVLGRDPDRPGNLLYLANHRPMLSSHVSMYNQQGRGYGALVVPCLGESTLIVTAPYYEKNSVVADHVRVGLNLPKAVGDVIREFGLDTGHKWGLVGEEFVSLGLYRGLISHSPQVQFVEADDILWRLRTVKDSEEQAILRQAARIADRGVEVAQGILRPGVSETELARAVEEELTGLGARDVSLTCQSGVERSNLPLVRPAVSSRVIAGGDMLHMEIRGTYRGYHFDICRGAVAGVPHPKQSTILKLVERMLDAVISAARPGVRAEELHMVAEALAEGNGFGSHFTVDRGGPSTYCGHGLGVDYDEPPILYIGDMTVLKSGMYLTPEPGIYETEVGGVRLEDDIIITDDGCEVLNRSVRYWISG